MLNDIQKAQIRRANKNLMLHKMTDYFMDLAGVYNRIDISAVSLAEYAVEELIKSGSLNELYQLKTA